MIARCHRQGWPQATPASDRSRPIPPHALATHTDGDAMVAALCYSMMRRVQVWAHVSLTCVVVVMARANDGMCVCVYVCLCVSVCVCERVVQLCQYAHLLKLSLIVAS